MTFTFNQNVSAQQLADILPNGVAILTHRYELVSVNRRFRELIPCPSVNFSECWLRSVHPDDYDRVSTGYREVATSKQPLRLEYHTRDPDSIWCVMTLDRLDDKDVQCFGLGDGGVFICTIADITPEKKAELLQRQAAEEAQERKKQQERFIDMISHEIRNPLSAIVHCTEDIQEAIYNKKPDEISVTNITEAAETISLCIRHQKKIVNDVLTFSKLDASMLPLSPRKVQPQRHLTIPMAIFRPELRKHKINFEYKADVSYSKCDIDWVMADLDRMGQVLVNILSNAIKFTAQSDGQRSIRVSVGASVERPSSYPPNIVFFDSGKSALRQDATNKSEWGSGEVAYIMVAVKDSGIGVTEDAQKRLFERFNQATPKTESIYGGSGLGLNVCRKLCHLHGGEIGVSSKKSHGSTFGFFFKVRRTTGEGVEVDESFGVSVIDKLCVDIQTLGNKMSGVNQSTEEPQIPETPAEDSVFEAHPGGPKDKNTIRTHSIARQVENEQIKRANQNPLSHRDHEKLTGDGQRILLVEDNVLNRRIISRKLSTLGFDISEASNGKEAVDANKNDTFDCILMDQQMPVMDGNCATKAIRDIEKETGGHVPILGLTANIREEQQQEMIGAGMDDIIHKPYGTSELVEKINCMVSKEGST
ncbi:CheY-like superfamily [Penicillium expansum]|uniref:CheY-like superfamily n=1 Tax=Penicillium expansum TaxID=27334 RepID=A0A0A2K287_PENEN|nr:CheY-like superfamily [Penicillium expansum]KGO36362.1 CheY-like superfamily [Penicillium expansum]KGO52571.1 CheY-like superfamily [Penicillium expansum]KGO61018.1 CheY-like superfamily [Penicillium expansum]